MSKSSSVAPDLRYPTRSDANSPGAGFPHWILGLGWAQPLPPASTCTKCWSSQLHPFPTSRFASLWSQKIVPRFWLKIMPILLDSLDSFDPLGDSFDPNFCCSTVAGCDRSKLPTWVNADLIEQQSLFDLLAYLISFSNFSNDSIAVLWVLWDHLALRGIRRLGLHQNREPPDQRSVTWRFEATGERPVQMEVSQVMGYPQMAANHPSHWWSMGKPMVLGCFR